MFIQTLSELREEDLLRALKNLDSVYMEKETKFVNGLDIPFDQL